MKRLFIAALFLNLFVSPLLAGSLSLLGVGVPPVSAGGACPQATTFLARVTVDATHQTAYTNLICGLVTDGIITGDLSTTGCGSFLDAFYILATQTSTAALLNICGSNFPLTPVGTPTFTADSGYKANAGADALDTGFNAATATSPNFSQNSASLAVWQVTSTTNANIIIGADSAGGLSSMFTPFTDGNVYSRINDASASAGFAASANSGFFQGNRSSSSATQIYQNGSSLGTNGANTSAAVKNANIFILRSNGASGSANVVVAAAAIGKSFSSTNVSNFNSRHRTYMTAVGVP